MRQTIWSFLLLLGVSACAAAPQRAGESAPSGLPPEEQVHLRRQIVAAQEQSARLEVQMSQFAQQLKTLANMVRQLQNQQNKLEDQLDRLRRELLAPKLTPAPSPAPRPQATAPPQTKEAPAKEERRPPSGGEQSMALPPEQAYNRAYRAAREKRSKEAILHFREFLERYPANRLAANAQYWLGESHYDLGEFRSALEELQKVVQRYPKSHKVPDALFKRGVTFLQIKDPRQAALEFEKLIEQFPQHPLTEKAKGQLRTLNLSGNNLRR